jgi:hypothetical protein
MYIYSLLYACIQVKTSAPNADGSKFRKPFDLWDTPAPAPRPPPATRTPPSRTGQSSGYWDDRIGLKDEPDSLFDEDDLADFGEKKVEGTIVTLV